jgi:predicted AAA+ superfamily ATPase
MQAMKRSYEYLIKENLKKNPCVAVLGPRRCGKRSMLKNLAGEWKWFNLERMKDYQVIARDAELFLRLHPRNIVIERAECLPELFPALHTVTGEEPAAAGRFLLLIEHLPVRVRDMPEMHRGHLGIIEVAPLSWAETHRLKSWPSFIMLLCDRTTQAADFRSLQPRDTLEAVQQYWLLGGYPEARDRKTKQSRRSWMDEYIRDYLFRDIARYVPGLDHARFSLFVRMLAGLSGTIVNYSEVGRTLGVSAPTAREYFGIAHETFLWRNIPPFTKNISKRVVRHVKGYVRDSGLLHHLLHIEDAESLHGHPQVDRSWKGMVAEEILRQLTCKAEGFEVSYYRTSAGAEVDLVIEADFGLIPFSIRHAGAAGWRQIRSLQDFVNEQGCRFGIIIDNAPTPRLLFHNIVAVPFSHL